MLWSLSFGQKEGNKQKEERTHLASRTLPLPISLDDNLLLLLNRSRRLYKSESKYSGRRAKHRGWLRLALWGWIRGRGMAFRFVSGLASGVANEDGAAGD